MRYSSDMTSASRQPLDDLAALAEPVRRRLYEYVAAQPAAVDRDEAAGGLGIGRPLAAFHLDRLVQAGLLEVEYHRRSGRSGPGAGRPAKFYRRPAGRDIEVSLPPRRYGLVAEILATGIERSDDDGVRDRVLDAARDEGERLAAAAGSATGRDGLLGALRASGYEPIENVPGVIRLRNCPFDSLVEQHRELTCSMNLALLSSLAEGVTSGSVSAEARPAAGSCCVAFVEAG
jgi:predicted ArsR family transcriptional regulator